MAKITESQYTKAYELARAIDARNMIASEAQRQLQALGMNAGSAQGYLRTIVHILRGELFRRTINKSAAAYILREICAREETAALQLALNAFQGHIEYYSKYGSHIGLRSIVAFYEEDTGELPNVSSLEERLSAQVQAAQALPREERLKRIKNASRRPRAQWARVWYFIRNPDIRAEVLFRANGTCEACGKAAPFRRFADGQPYLEVHHKIPLAEGGEDTLDNSLAVCPNCHREAHHGLDRDRFRVIAPS